MGRKKSAKICAWICENLREIFHSKLIHEDFEIDINQEKTNGSGYILTALITCNEVPVETRTK
jgi:hypothetical protein